MTSLFWKHVSRAIGIGFFALTLIFILAEWFTENADAAVEGLTPETVFVAEKRDTPTYIREGLIQGGDRSIEDILILNIRHAQNRGYERLVLDIEGNQQGQAQSISTSPYFQVAITPELKRLVVTVWGKPRLVFDAKKVSRSFQRSKVYQGVELLPVVDSDRWSFVLHLKKDVEVKVFELGNPVRVVVDTRPTRH